VQDGSCVTVTVRPATVTVPVRALVPVLAVAVSVTGPEPLLDAGLAVSQAAPLDVVQPHPAVVVTVTVAVPPAAVAVSVVGETV